jgi:glutamate-1-semialdehyde 2,1-aminomutase
MISKHIMNEGYVDEEGFISSGKGSNIFINNKKVLDLSLCAGSLILGHNSKIFKNSVQEVLKFNISNFAAKNLYAAKLSNTLKKVFPQYSKFIFCNSGTEAVMKSLRVARAITKKDLIISASGSWHGSTGELLFTNNNKFNNIALSAGLDKNYSKKLKFIPYNNIAKSKKILDKNRKKIMCIIIEPVQGCLPMNAKKYLKFLNDYAKKNKILLIFDEIITGIRFNCSSIQTEFKLHPSISTFGKCLGGGFPMGIIALKKDIVDKLKRNKKSVFFGGTFSGNSINAYVGNKVVNYIIKNKKNIFKSLNQKALYLETKLNDFFTDNNFDAKCFRFASMLRIVFTKKDIKNRTQRDFFEKKNKTIIERFRKFLLKNKIYYAKSGIIFLATTTNYSDINHLINTVKKGFKRNFK